MRAGEWLEQLRRSIEDADLFLALCSSDYAEAGTVSAWELEHAEEILGSNRIAPIRLGSVRPKVWDRLSRLHALDVEDPLNDTSDELEQFLRSCLGSLTAGLSAGCEP
jgi:hypothetical protein